MALAFPLLLLLFAYAGMRSVVGVVSVVLGVLLGGVFAYQGRPPQVIATRQSGDAIEQDLDALLWAWQPRDFRWLIGGAVGVLILIGSVYALMGRWWDGSPVLLLVLMAFFASNLISEICWIWVYIRILHTWPPNDTS